MEAPPVRIHSIWHGIDIGGSSRTARLLALCSEAGTDRRTPGDRLFLNPLALK
jgi:hypothetical protein